MMRISAGLGAMLVLSVLASLAAALGMESFGNEPLAEGNYSRTLVPVVNHASRIYQSWVNGHELLYYRGDQATLNGFLEKFAATEAPQHRVLLVPGHGRAASFHGKPVEFDWKVELLDGIARQMFREEDGNRIWPENPTVTVYMGDRKLDDLNVPAGIQLVTLDDLKGSAIPAIEKSSSRTVRGWGCGVLASLDSFDRGIMSAIAGRLDDEDDWVKLNAVGALAHFGRRAAEYAPQLRALAETTGDQGLKDAIAQTLATIGHSPAEDEAAILQHNLQLRRIENFVKQR